MSSAKHTGEAVELLRVCLHYGATPLLPEGYHHWVRDWLKHDKFHANRHAVPAPRKPVRPKRPSRKKPKPAPIIWNPGDPCPSPDFS